MALDAFRFTISLPADADLPPLLREVSGHMARYLGLPEERAQDARETLERAVAERLSGPRAGTRPIRVTFERPPNGSAATVEVTWDAAARESPDEEHAARRFSWHVHDGK